MSDIEKLAAKRLDKTSTSMNASPLDLLRAAAHDLETGRVPCDGIVIVFMHRPGLYEQGKENDEPWTCTVHRAKMTADQELVALELAKDQCKHRWLDHHG